MLQDFRFALRSLWKTPEFTLTVAMTLALGIGVNSIIFSVVNAALFRPLPYPDPDRLVMIWETRQVDPNQLADPKSVAAIEWMIGDRQLPRYQQNGTFSAIAGYSGADVSLTGGTGEPERLRAGLATPELFPLLGIRTSMGRTFQAEEDRPGNNRFAILSHAFWQRRFGGDPRALGATLTLEGEPHTVIGILPAGAKVVLPKLGEDPRDLWLPSSRQITPKQKFAQYYTIGRLKPGVAVAQAKADLDSIGRTLEQERKRGLTGISLVPVIEQFSGKTRPALLILLAAVGCVLLVGCANGANLMLARRAARHSEIALRVALGATRGRLLRQTVAESLILGAIGGAAGLAAARLAGRALLLWIPPKTIPRLDEVTVDWRVLLFVAALSLLAALVFGLPAALLSAPESVYEALKQGSAGSGGSRTAGRIRRLMAVAEIALAVMLVIGAGLLIRSFARLRGVDLGFQPARVTTMSVKLPEQRYREPRDRTAFAEQVLQRLRGAPGVENAAAANFIPIGAAAWTTVGIGIEGRSGNVGVNYRVVTPGYFDAMGMRIKRGRAFTDRDSDASVIVNEAAARRFWPDGGEILGRRVRLDKGWAEIVGLLADVKHEGAARETEAELYAPFSLNLFAGIDFVVRTRVGSPDPAVLLRTAVKAVDASFPVGKIRTMDQIVSESVATPRFYMRLLSLFAALAAALAAVGIYGLIAYSAVQRRHEIGVRVAIGASRGAIVWMMLREGLMLGVTGAAAGLLAAFAATRYLESLLFAVKPADPLTFVAVGAGFIAVAVAASCVPALRTGRIDPVITLRDQ